MIKNNNNKDEEEYHFTPRKLLIYCLIVGLTSVILSILIDGLRLLSMAAFVFASITIWYMFGEKFHKWQERKKEQKHTTIRNLHLIKCFQNWLIESLH